jgi:uncharacterized protein (TIGR03437 family)
MKQNLVPLLLLILPACGLAQMPGMVMQVDIDNWVIYNYDVPDRTTWAQSAGPTVPAPAPPAFGSSLLLADIVAVNSKPAKGLALARFAALNLRPSPTPGQAISDVNRSGVVDILLELLDSDGASIGSIMTSGLNAGSAPPGAPLNFPGNNVAITGGTGAFVGMRGQISAPAPLPSVRPPRQASVSEDPANRRSLGGGGVFRFTLHLLPVVRPTVASVFHSDFTPVSASSPARAGETLIVSATGLGPTRPGVDPEQPFPASPLQEVNSPVEVTVNGQAVVIVNKLGWPGTIGNYRIDFRIPDGIASGMATVQLSAAFISGPATQIPIQ